VTRFPRLGLRARLVIAFVGVALLAADMATVYSNLNLNSHVSSAAQARLARSATHFGDLAGVVFRDSGGWTPGAITTLRHLAEVDSLAVAVTGDAGRAVLTIAPSRPVEHGASMTTPVMANGAKIAQVTVSQSNGQLLTPEELQLRHELNRMHLVAGVTSAAIALAVALYLALTLSRPLRQIRAGAEAMEKGDLEARLEEEGDNEIRAIARALNRLAETLQHEEKLRKESVADLSHELRTPVMGLLARIEAAQDGVLRDQAANLTAMHEEADRLSLLLEDMSALADAERPGLLLAREPVDLAAVAEAQWLLFSDRFAEKRISLADDFQPTVVDGDPSRLEQIVVNLLSNALRYTDAGGRVRIGVRSAAGDAILEVADTGIGIPAEDVPHVFTRFWRGEKSRSRAKGGAGIGLSIVQELVRAHGGRITVESQPGAGSVFRVIIPARRESRLH
jgi:two-component system, OmpR family, sensor histidine kinase BaeS